MAELANRLDLADAFAGKLLNLNRKQAAEFRDLLGVPPNPKKVPKSFWERVKKDQEEEILAALLLIFLTSYDAHSAWGDREPPKDTERRDNLAERWTKKRADVVSRELVAHSADMLNTAGKAWEMKARKGVLIPSDDVDDLTEKIFGPGRAKVVAYTETQQGMVSGGEGGVKHSGFKVTAYWCHSELRPAGHSNAAKQPCVICSRYEGRPETQWGGYRPGQVHPNDDCYPGYVDEDGYMIGTDNLLLIPGNVPGRAPWKFLP